MQENTDNLPAEVQTKSIVKLEEGKGLIPQDLDGLWRLSQIMCKSGFVPKDMANRPEAVFAACQLGYELGLSPMQSVQNISVINGRPSVWGDTVLALVRSSGKLTSFSEKIEGTGENMVATCTVHRNKEVIQRSFSVADAIQAGLWGKNTWASYPARMLQMRARSWALRDGFGDILKGIQSREEVMDYVDLAETQNGTYEPTQEEQPEAVDTSKFDILVDEQPNYMKSKLDEFIQATAEANDSTVENLKFVAIEKFDEFWGSYEKWFYPKALAHAKENDPASYETASQIHECVGYEIAKMKPIQQKAVYETYRKMKK